MDVGERTQMVMDRIAYESNADAFAEKSEIHVYCYWGAPGKFWRAGACWIAG